MPGSAAAPPSRSSHPAGSVHLSRAARVKLMVVVPLTMLLLVASTGYFTLRMTERSWDRLGPRASEQVRHRAERELSVQVTLIGFIAGLLGLSLSYGIMKPLREMSHKLEAFAAGDLREPIDLLATSEFDSLAVAFNDVVTSLNRYVFQSMTGAVVTLNSEGRVTGYSTAAELILGYREEEVLGRRFSEIFTPAGGDRAGLQAIESAISAQRPFSLDETQILTKRGDPVRIGMSISYLRGDRESVIGVMITFKDLTEIRRLREQFRQADQLVVLGTLTAGVAHELRNPLGAMQGLLDLLAEDVTPGSPGRQYIERINTSIERLNRLVEDLLLFSSPSPKAMDPVPLDDLVKEIVSLERHEAGGLGIEVSEQYDAGTAHVLGNRDRLAQALLNILRNAVQATPAGGRIGIRTMDWGGQASVAVHNTGSYIPDHQRGDVFIPFYSTKSGGTGLGLPIARQIVLAHAGRIEVASDQEAGTTFTIELPVAQAPGSSVESVAALAG